MDHSKDLMALLAVAGRPVRVEEAAAALDLEPSQLLDVAERLVADGALVDRTEGLVLGDGEIEPTSPSRRAFLAGRWAEALIRLDGEPIEIGRALLAAGQHRAAAERLIPVALAGRVPEAVEAALEAGLRAETLGPEDEGRLRLARATHRRGRGDSVGAAEDLEVAMRRLDGAELVDALGFAAAVADDLQRPQQAETLTAMAASQSARIGEPAKLGSLLTLHGRSLSRVGFPSEADRVLEVGAVLVAEHGDAFQRHLAQMNQAWVWLDRGELRKAEAAFARLRDQARDMDPVTLADREAYWARSLFGIGHATEALAAADRAEQLAHAEGANAPRFIAALARSEGSWSFGRFSEAASHAESVLEIVRSAMPAWENVGLVQLARALAGQGLIHEATEAIDQALAATPAGIDGWRWRVHAEVVKLSLTEDRWPQRRAEDLTDALLQARWFTAAAHLMAERSERESDRELGLQGAALALQNGSPMLAAVAVERAGAWDDPAVAPVARAIRSLQPHVPEEWQEEWAAYPPVRSALAIEVDSAVEPTVLQERIDEALQAAGLAGADVVLSPAQRQARGLVRRRPTRARRPLRVAAAALAVVALSAVTALGVTRLGTDTEVPPTTLAVPTTTIAATTTVPRLEDTVVPIPESGVAGEALHRGDPARTGVTSGGFRNVLGIYWRQEPGGFFGTDPVAYGRVLYLGSNTDDKLLYLSQDDGSVLFEVQTGNRVRSSPTVQRIGGVTYLVFGADDGRVYATDAFRGDQAALWTTDVGGIVSNSPLFIDQRVVVATEAGAVVALDAEGGGAETWRYVGTERAPLAPVDTAPAYADGIVYVVDQEARLHLIDVETGEGLCEPFQGFAPLARDSNPIIADGVVYLPTTSGMVHLLAAGSCSESPRDRQSQVTASVGFAHPPVISGDVIYALEGFRLVALDALTGQLSIWEVPFDAGDRITTAPVLADGVLYIGTQDGMVYAVDASDGSELWRFDAGEPIGAAPAVVTNAVFVTTVEGTVIAIGGE